MAEWISELEAGRGDGPRDLTWSDGQSFFFRVRELLGFDPAAARHLASHWPMLSRNQETKPWALRTKAVLQRLDGQWAASARTFQKAAAGVVDPIDQMEFQLGAVDSLGRCGRVREAVTLGTRLAQGLAKGGRPTDAGRAWLNVANALLWHDRYREAATAYQSSLRLLSPDDPMVGSALLGVSTGELFGGRPRDAIAAAERAAAHFNELGANQFESVSRMNLGHAALLLGRLDEALDAFLAARTKVEPDSPDSARLEEFIGDCYSRLNLFDEAEVAYHQALAGRSTGLNKANAQYGLGQVAEVQEKLSEADRWFKAARSSYLRFGNEPWAGVCLAARSRIARKERQLGTALRLAQLAVEDLRRQRATYHLSEALLDLADAEAELLRDPSPTLEEATRLIRRGSYLALRWRVSHLHARRTNEPECFSHYRRMVSDILSVRALTTSLVSRTAFYRDKSDALGSYVGRLLEKPTRRRIQEAANVIRNVRSVALLEEILSQENRLSPEIIASLAELREEINVALSSESSTEGTRRLTTTRGELSRLQRCWLEMTRFGDASGIMHASPGRGGAILAHTPVGLYLLSETTSKRFPCDSLELESALRRLKFELYEPMVDKGADPACAQASVELLNSLLGKSLTLADGSALSPDGLFWQMPWPLLGLEPVLTLGPWNTHEFVTLPKRPRAAVWYQEHSDLPHVAREVHVFRSRFPEARVCSTIDEVRDSLSNDKLDVLHVATHARFHSSNPMFSHLEFNNGVVTAAEIARSGLSCNIVCLSACETGMVSHRNRSEPEGLVRSFLSRGAARVVASSWPLDDEAAELFAYHFYDGLTQGADVTHSVAKSRRAVRSNFVHPYYWGSFLVFGGYLP